MRNSSTRYIYRLIWTAFLLMALFTCQWLAGFGFEPGVDRGDDLLSIGKGNGAETYRSSYRVISVPLDSRPVSNDYLGFLIGMAGESFANIGGDTSILDICPSDELHEDHTGEVYRESDLEEVRRRLSAELAETEGQGEGTAILAMPMLLNKGLIASRSPSNYPPASDSYEYLKETLGGHGKLRTVAVAVLPKARPDDRAYDIWPGAGGKLKGLDYYYGKRQAGAPGKEVEPSEGLLEYSYVKSKMKHERLDLWETDFMEGFEADYADDPIYGDYVRLYESLFERSRAQTSALIDLVHEGVIDELVIGMDDFQLPRFYSKRGKSEKYGLSKDSFDMICRYQEEKIRGDSLQDSLSGAGESINYILGADELPQLSYARDLSRRMEMTSRFSVRSLNRDSGGGTGEYDFMGLDDLVSQRMSFVANRYEGSPVVSSTRKPFHMYSYVNAKNADNVGNVLEGMVKESKDVNVGVIEIPRGGKAEIFDRLLESESLASISTYSSWNTQGNASGLGIAHSQVLGLVDEHLGNDGAHPGDYEKAALNHSKLLSTHLLEDGIYNGRVRDTIPTNPMLDEITGRDTEFCARFGVGRRDTMDGFVVSGRLSNRALGMLLANSGIMDSFSDRTRMMNLGDRSFCWKVAGLSNYSFPWSRRFDCFVEAGFEGLSIK